MRKEAQQAGKTVHCGRIVEHCHEEGSELEIGDPERKMKGRSVLLGDKVRDQDFSWAEFCELGSSPPSIEAAKALDAMGSPPGYRVKTGDARGAYTRARLLCAETSVTLPDNRSPRPCTGTFHAPVGHRCLILS